MPTYGYRCSSCGHQFEILQKMSDAPLTTCPKCQGKLTKVIYPTGIIYKGSGYYTTDYKATKQESTPSNGSDPSSSDSSTDSSSSSETKAESKSKSGSESKSEGKGSSKKEKSE